MDQHVFLGWMPHPANARAGATISCTQLWSYPLACAVIVETTAVGVVEVDVTDRTVVWAIRMGTCLQQQRSYSCSRGAQEKEAAQSS